MKELVLLSTSHIVIVFLCILSIIYIPKYFSDKSARQKKIINEVYYFYIIN